MSASILSFAVSGLLTFAGGGIRALLRRRRRPDLPSARVLERVG
jgi:hypothetical protein